MAAVLGHETGHVTRALGKSDEQGAGCRNSASGSARSLAVVARPRRSPASACNPLLKYSRR